MSNPLDTFSYDQLHGGDNVKPVTQPITVVSGSGVLKRGTVLGMITSGRKRTGCSSAASDGSQLCESILCEDIDATSADVVTTSYEAGEFIEGALIWPHTPDTADTVVSSVVNRDRLRDQGIYLHTNVGTFPSIG